MITVFHLSVPFSLLLGAIGSATAPASSLMTIRQYHAKGNFVNTLIQVVAMDDAVALLAFSACAAVAAGMESTTTFSWESTLLPLAINLGVLLGAYLLGRLLCVLLQGRVLGPSAGAHLRVHFLHRGLLRGHGCLAAGWAA